MIGNNSELLDHIRMVGITGGGMFRIFYHILLFVWKNMGGNDEPLISKQQRKPVQSLKRFREKQELGRG